MNFEHNSWDTIYRHPFGAVPTGSEVVIRARGEGVSNVRLRIFYGSYERYFDMIPSSEHPGLFEYKMRMPVKPGLLWYDFRFDADGRNWSYGTQKDGLGGPGEVCPEGNPSSFQITLYDPARRVPRWYKEGVIYQIFPDRFNSAAWPGFKPEFHSHSVVHGHWNDKPHYFRKEDGSIDYYDFFGGNLPGIIEKLDYLKDLGITIIYLNPIFDSISNHKYDTADYHRIAPEFGDAAIFSRLCQEAGKRGIRIILDGVFNHTGDDSIYFNRYGHFDNVGAYQSENSPYRSWYQFTEWPNDYESWWGIKTMPNLEETSPELENFIYKDKHSVVKRWLRAGASGWRLDVADELPDSFIAGIKQSVLEEKPDAVLIGEVWEDASRKEAYGKIREYFEGEELDSVMNYPFRDCFISFFLGDIDSAEAARLMMSLTENYPKENFMSNMNLIGSHDRARILTMLGEADQSMTVLEKENYRLRPENRELAEKRLKLISLLQMTFPGVPTVYYADEAGAEGFEDPYNRGTYPWGNEDTGLMDWYKKIIALRNSRDILRKGDWRPYPSDRDLFVYERTWNGQKLLILINRSQDNPGSFSLADTGHSAYTDILTGAKVTSSPVLVEPLSALVLDITPVENKRMIPRNENARQSLDHSDNSVQQEPVPGQAGQMNGQHPVPEKPY
ncbi:MAG: glycoside hydrolase family 13 protein [Eubacteriaceae bacterium]|jgi:glycosidase